MRERIVAAALVVASGGIDASTVAGVTIFAVGILVGLAAVLATDRLVRRRIRRDYEDWVASGRPDRRHGERRGRRFRRDG